MDTEGIEFFQWFLLAVFRDPCAMDALPMDYMFANVLDLC